MKSFSGATVKQVSTYIKPTIEEKPDSVILHIGTDDFKSIANKNIYVESSESRNNARNNIIVN